MLPESKLIFINKKVDFVNYETPEKSGVSS